MTAIELSKVITAISRELRADLGELGAAVNDLTRRIERLEANA
jgi:hypothetical protein